MKYALLIALIGGCGKDATMMMAPSPDSAPVGMVTNISGHITADVTWSGTVNITNETTIDPGVTVTVAAGTAFHSTESAITIDGTLDIQGTSAAKVTAGPSPATAPWEGLMVPTGGVLTATYFVELGGGIHTSGSGKVTITDSQMSHMGGDDLLTMSGGTLDLEYSWIGIDVGQTPADTTHCDMHVETAGNIIKVEHSNLSTGVYGIMFYGGTGADFTYNNWFSNSVDIDVSLGSGQTGDFSNSWFAKGAPTASAKITANNMASARLTDAGPRP